MAGDGGGGACIGSEELIVNWRIIVIRKRREIKLDIWTGLIQLRIRIIGKTL